MASLTARKIGNKTYYYLCESKRINGKPTLVKQVYLGRAEQILEKIENNRIEQGIHFKFGLEAALYQVASEVGLEGVINDSAIGSSPSLDVGRMIVVAAINRVCQPTSKNGIRNWWNKTTLPELFSIHPKNIDSRRFWDAMDRLPEEEIPVIEERIWENLLKIYRIPMDVLLYDTTNFYTYMDSATASDLCRRGHNKAGKHHLRQVGVSMAVSKGCGIPFLHEVYQGSINDATLFPTAISTLIERVRDIHRSAGELTIVFDKGNNSKANFEDLQRHKNVYILGSLTPSQFPELIRTQLSRYSDSALKSGKKVKYFARRMKVFGRESLVVITFNEKLKKKRERKFSKYLGKVLAAAAGVQWSRVKDCRARLKELTRNLLPASLFDFAGEGGDTSCVINSGEVRKYKKRFGKNIMFTTNLDMDPIQVIQYYRDRNEVEEIFGQMNDPEATSLRPIYHWTDQKIVIHAFICILGLLLLKVLHHKIRQHNPDASPGKVTGMLRDLQSLALISKSKKVKKVMSFHNDEILNWLAPLGLESITKKLDIHIPKG